MMKKISFLAIVLWCTSCGMSLREQGKVYFAQNIKIPGVEDPNEFKDRLKKSKYHANILYKKDTYKNLINCVWLRNQLVSASFFGYVGADSKKSIEDLERSFQDSEESFLFACEGVLADTLGKEFLAVQKEYLSKEW